MKHDIMDTAKWFIEKNGGQISSKKLQKLCYYAQAWSYAIRDCALFSGLFRAWVHGPVNGKLWESFKDISYRDITLKDFSNRKFKTISFSEEEKSFLERVWDTYGEFSGYQLETLTQNESPWLEKRSGLDAYEHSNKVISTKTMKEYYRSIYIESQDA